MAEFIWNSNFFRELGYSSPVVNITETLTDLILVEAKASAPYVTGAYQRSIHKQMENGRYRKVGVVLANDTKSAVIEARTHNLAKAARRIKRG